MLPIRDTIQSRNYPVVNTSIIAANVLFFMIEMTQGDRLDQFFILYGLVPARYSVPEISSHFSLGQQVFPFLSFMFIHGGFWHLFGNMWSLYIFGDNVEDRLGPFRYLMFYLLCGLGSGLSHLVINWHSQIPTVGASGAIAGVMGAYFILYPRSRILTLIPIIIIPYFVELPAFIFLGIWFLLQFLSAAGASAHAGGIAWWAHIGGFIFGILFLKLFLQVPETKITQLVRQKTYKHKTPRLQVIHTTGSAGDPHLHGTITVTPREAFLGTRKLVNIPWGFQKRLFKVTVPPGISDATTLRLTGLGKKTADDTRGDLYLKVIIHQ
jgi:membrane associated rhomboid family serine protease